MYDIERKNIHIFFVIPGSLGEGKMQIITVVTGSIEENCHIVYDEEKNAIVIDPGDDFLKIKNVILENCLSVQKIVLTHGHYDHVGAVNQLKEFSGAFVYAQENEKELINRPELSLSMYFDPMIPTPMIDFYVAEGEVISAGKNSLRVMHTPGHTEGSMCLYSDGVLFSGDTVFYKTLGRWDFPTGNLSKLTHSIVNIIFSLPEETVIYSGHGPKTTVKEEKMHNEVYRWLSV